MRNIDANGCVGYNGVMDPRPEAPPTASLNIRQLDPALKERLRVRAARNGRSMEAEARLIIREALAGAEKPRATGAELAESIRRRFAPLGGVELEPPPREPVPEPPGFG
jgi:antitoxin FitA